jgi:hypothetical protein
MNRLCNDKAGLLKNLYISNVTKSKSSVADWIRNCKLGAFW